MKLQSNSIVIELTLEEAGVLHAVLGNLPTKYVDNAGEDGDVEDASSVTDKLCDLLEPFVGGK